MAFDFFPKSRAEGLPGFFLFLPPVRLFFFEARVGMEKWNRQVSPQCITVEVGNVQIIPGSIIGLPLKGTAWIVAALDEVPLFVFNGDLMWCEYETLILPDKMCGQTFLVKSRLNLN